MSIIKKAAALLLALSLAAATAPVPARAAEYDLDAAAMDTAACLQKTVTSPGIGQTGGDWTIIALRRSGAEVPDEYYQAYYDNARDYVRKCSGVLSTVKYSEYSRTALALASLGADTTIAGYSLLDPLLDFEGTVRQGINGPVFALLALTAASDFMPVTSGEYVDYILSRRLDDGGFAMSGEISDPDTTALALTALYAYSEREDVSAAIESGLSRLSGLQRDTGGYVSYGTVTSESVSQVIIALQTLGVSLDDERFVKNGVTLLDNLMEYYIPGEGFEHELGRGFNLMATEQALCALAAVIRQREGRPALYDMSDVTPVSITTELSALPGKHPDVSVPGKLPHMDAISDISGIDEEAAIYKLMRRGIVTGYPDGSFGPDKTLTRAEFAAIITRALGLADGGDGGSAFSDADSGEWYYGAVSAAASYGIIQGRGDGTFDPGGTLTRQEAAVMISRAAALCGMETGYGAEAARSVLSQFTDYRQIADWASGAMAFCFDNDLLDQSDIESRPADDILRREMAELTYRLLVASMLVEPGE